MNAKTAFEETAVYFDNLEPLFLADLKADKSVLLIVDMINGFAVSGALASGRIGALIPVIAELSKKCDKKGIQKLAFSDSHSQYSTEFSSYPPHCLEGTQESGMVDALKAIGGYTHIAKNSTNGFLEEEFLRFLVMNSCADTFILAGGCTDICILQLALALKAHFNRLNMASRIVVPKNAVNTYDSPRHNAELTNIMALYNMKINGIEIVERIT